MLSAAYTKRLATAITGAALASALAVSGASARPLGVSGASPQDSYVDLRSPDARDAAADSRSRHESNPAVNKPSPSNGYVDLRSPDARDAADDSRSRHESNPAVNEPSPSNGFDLPSAGIGAAAGTGLLIVVLAAAGLAGRRPLTRRHRAAPPERA